MPPAQHRSRQWPPGALIGPSQVAARIFEASFLSRYPPLLSGRLALR